MKVNASVLIGSRKPVLQIAFYVKAYGSQLGPDLMVPAGVQFDLKKMKPVG
jgi:hypothetical protein